MADPGVRPVIVLANAAGILAVDIEANYPKGISLFTRGLRAASPKTREYNILMINLAKTYCFRNDSAGFRHARQVVEFAEDTDDAFLQLQGSLLCADFSYQAGRFQEASDFTRRAAGLADDSSTLIQTYTLFGKIHDATGDMESARKTYRRAGRYVGGRDILADAWLAMGNHRKALDYYKRYQTESSRLFNIEKEQSMSELRIRYDIEDKERRLHSQQVKMLAMRQHVQLLVAVIVLIVVVLGASFLYEKARMYRLIVKQYHEFQERRKILARLLRMK